VWVSIGQQILHVSGGDDSLKEKPSNNKLQQTKLAQSDGASLLNLVLYATCGTYGHQQ
jgi:hypothetical protein